MKEFEYRLYPMPSTASRIDVETVLNRLGAEGWELCATDYGSFILKREKR